MFKDKKIMVVGMAKSGVASAKYLLNQGSKVVLNDVKKESELKDIIDLFSDNKNASFIFGRKPLESEIDGIDMIILSPGVSPELDFIKYAIANNIRCISEVELAYLGSKEKNIDFIGITGTNGKTTTTSIIGEIFISDKKDAHIVGNIGFPVIEAVENGNNNSCMVTELSSFQLESIDEFRTKICTVLNLTPDHLNRHHTIENYANAKMNIFKNQKETDVCVLNFDDEITRNMKNKARSKVVFFSRKNKRNEIIANCKNEDIDTITVEENGDIVYTTKTDKISIMNSSELSLPGGHNLENAMAAIGVSLNYNINIDTIVRVLKTFKAVEHRLEYVDTINGVDFVNDSKGTNPDSTIKAVTSYENPIILIAGGYDKQSDFTELFEIGKKNIKAIVSMGQTASIIEETARKCGIENIYEVESMSDAVKKSYEISSDGDVVLLSPACASWGMYNNYEERGRDFKACVLKLKK